MMGSLIFGHLFSYDPVPLSRLQSQVAGRYHNKFADSSTPNVEKYHHNTTTARRLT